MTKDESDTTDTDTTETDVTTETDSTATEVVPTAVEEAVADAQDAEADETEADEVGSDFEPDEVDDDEPRRRRRSVRRMLVPLLLTVLLLASAGVATWVYLSMYRPDQQNNDDAVAARVVQAASDGTVALLSYAPDSMDKDFANAKSHLTGEFLDYYTRFTTQIVTPAVKTKAVKTSAAVVRKALSQLQPTSAEVLLFVNQSTTSKENPDGAFASSSVKVGLKKVGNDWLISSFDPV